MTVGTTQSKGTWSGPSLAMAIAAACAVMADSADSSQTQANKPLAQVAQPLGSSVESLIESAVSVLKSLEASMEKHTKALCQDELPKHFIDDQPFGLIADNLRFVEKQLHEFGPPVGVESEYNKLVRALAKARSVAVMNDSLIRQWTTTPETFVSDIDLDGLKTLTDHTTRRLGAMVG